MPDRLLNETEIIRYSTTQGTNALVQAREKGPRLGVLLQSGTAIADMLRSSPEESLFGTLVGQRVAHLEEMDDDEEYGQAIIAAVNTLLTQGTNRIVLALDGEHYEAREQRFRKIFLRKYPRHFLGAVPVLLAHELTRADALASRMWSGLLNSFLHPTMEHFLYNAENELRKRNVRRPLMVFRNDGNSSRVSRTVAIKTYSSGPRGGMEGTKVYAEAYSAKHVISFDVGGTTTDIGVAFPGSIEEIPHGKIEGAQTAFPLCDILSAGVGGSSVLGYKDGRYQVGPQSVGAAPGPACFARGGELPTITDVYLLMGIFDPKTYFAGKLKIDRTLAEKAIQQHVGQPAGKSLETALLELDEAYHQVMADAVTGHAAVDADTVLMAFGGAGPMSACMVADLVGVDTVIVPHAAAVFCAYPSHMLGALPVTLSHLVSGRKSEYARTTSAIINASLHSIMYHGLATMEQQLRDAHYSRAMMLTHNSGGMAQLNSTSALQTIHSGPVAGINAAERLAQQAGVTKLVCADMGGTSFDISLVVGGDVKFYDFYPVIDRWLCTTPMVHLLSLGAGGGSIARFDPIFKSVEVGPESAGSEPGPACFNQGGTRPTVTDTDLVLGYLDPTNYAAGRIKLNKRRAERAVEDDVADPMGLTVPQAALAIKAKVDASMAVGIGRELRAKGYEPGEFTMLAYGGNGPLHACGISEAAGIKRIFVPPFSAVFSALGAGNIDQIHIHEHTKFFWLYDSEQKAVLEDFDDINDLIEELEAKGKADMMRQGLNPQGISHRLELDMRYGNQLAQTSVVTELNRFSSREDVIHLIGQFAQDYQQRFGEGSAQPQAGVVVTAVRVVTSVDDRKIDFSGLSADTPARDDAPTPASRRTCYFRAMPEGADTPVYKFEDIQPGQHIAGPAIVVSRVTTILVEPHWDFRMAQEGAAWLIHNEQ